MNNFNKEKVRLLRRTSEIFDSWKTECEKPFNIVFNIEISKSDFDQMINEVEELQEENKRYREALEEIVKGNHEVNWVVRWALDALNGKD